MTRTVPDPRPPAATTRRADLRVRAHAAAVGAVDGLLGIALPVAVLGVVGLIGWAGVGGATAWTAALHVAADAWWIGHGVDLRLVAAGTAPVPVTAAALGPALVTAAAAVRAGRRAAGTGDPTVAWAAQVASTAVAALLLLLLGSSGAVAPVAWQAVVLPVALVAVASLLALRAARHPRPLPDGVRTGLAAALLLLAAAGVLLCLLLLARFADVVGLYETLSPGPAGGMVLTLLQVLAVPTLVVWTAAWTAGAPVQLGTGSSSGPFGADVGPLPALPVLGAVPASLGAAAAAVLLVPVLAGFAAALLARRRGVAGRALPLGLTTGGVAGLVLGLLVAASAGAAGPGRFAATGPDALVVAALVAVLTGAPAALAAAVVPPRAAEPTEDPADADR